MRDFIEIWLAIQNWVFETAVAPVLFQYNLMEWYEPGFEAVEFVMLGIVQIAAIVLIMRVIERRWPLERGGDDRLIGVDRVYTVLNKLGVVPLAIFIIAFPITQQIEYTVRALGLAPPRIEHLVPWLHGQPLASFLVYFALYDFAAYWVHRAQHRFSWWWALHSLHHSQRRMTVWTDDRNHILDDFLVTLVLAVFSQMVGVQPEDYVLIIVVGRMVESWSHANIDISFGRVGEKLLVGPRFHRQHHALATPGEPRIHDHNYAPVFPIWDILFGTANYDGRHRPTGVDDPAADADNGRGWIAQQVAGFGRFAAALLPGLKRA